ncbi:MAG: pyridoxamine 5'-phosphate oxidase [Candidatus Methylacidiphilales bacterium]
MNVDSASVAELRREYSGRGLDRESLAADPINQFRTWFEQAREANLLEPNAMTLATADRSGRVTARTVLLKAFDARGFVFFTNYGSRKATQIAENPQVALLFTWLQLERQVEITGTAEKISTAESLAYFASRPFGSRLGAWVSQQSQIIPSRKVLEMKFEEMRRKFANGDVPLPDFWGGYRVVPHSIEFWQGCPSRLHDRFLYQRDSTGTWTIARLSP